MFEDYLVPESKCLNCGKEMDAAAPVTGGRAPQEGDMAICFDCGHLQFYGVNLVMRNPTDAEIIEVAGDPELIRAMTLVGEYHKWRDRNATQTADGNRASRRASRKSR